MILMYVDYLAVWCNTQQSNKIARKSVYSTTVIKLTKYKDRLNENEKAIKLFLITYLTWRRWHANNMLLIPPTVPCKQLSRISASIVGCAQHNSGVLHYTTIVLRCRSIMHKQCTVGVPAVTKTLTIVHVRTPHHALYGACQSKSTWGFVLTNLRSNQLPCARYDSSPSPLLLLFIQRCSLLRYHFRHLSCHDTDYCLTASD